MKKCPQCNQTFSDQTNFCLSDGTPLVRIMYEDSVATQVLPHSHSKPPFQNVGTGPSKSLYLLIGAMGVALIAMALYVFLPRSTIEKVDAVNKTAKTDLSPTPTDTIQQRPGLASNPNSPVVSQTNPYVSPSGRWSGNWMSNKSSFSAVATFNETAGKVSGQIVWTIQSTSNPAKMNKIGTTAVEYVQGTFNPQTQMLDVKGYRKDDPNSIIILDNYHLSVAVDNQTIIGKSINGQFTLRR